MNPRVLPALEPAARISPANPVECGFVPSIDPANMLRFQITRLCSVLLTTALLCFASLSSSAQSAPDLHLGDEIRAGVRWLRSMQNAEDGSYGGGVAGTAWALRALAECPDQYRAIDGPFVRKALEYLRAHQK